ncbi:hypothetical protein V8F20_004997 [Naviculisporaceae sp. PSN 640]
MCNIISQLFTCCKHKQFQNIYQCSLITTQMEVQSNGHQTTPLFFSARVVPDKFSSLSAQNPISGSEAQSQNLRTMLILCETCPNLRRPSRPVGGYCRDCRRAHLRGALQVGASMGYGSRLGELGGWGELPPLPRVDLTPSHARENGEHGNGGIFVSETVEGADAVDGQRSDLAGLARIVAGALDDVERGTAEDTENKDGTNGTGRRLRRKLRGKVRNDGNESPANGKKLDVGKKESISSSSEHTSGSSATLVMGMMTTTTMSAVGGSSTRGGQEVGVAV